MGNDPNYLSCGIETCSQFLGDTKGKDKKKPKKDKSFGDFYLFYTCSGSVTFHVINIRTNIEFVLLNGGYAADSCVLTRSGPISFANPSSLLYGHISSTDSTCTVMRLTWISGDTSPQQVQYGNGQYAQSTVTTFTRDQMCVVPCFPSPAADFGWHDPELHSFSCYDWTTTF